MTGNGQGRLQQVVVGVEQRFPILVRVSAVDEKDIGEIEYCKISNDQYKRLCK